MLSETKLKKLLKREIKGFYSQELLSQIETIPFNKIGVFSIFIDGFCVAVSSSKNCLRTLLLRYVNKYSNNLNKYIVIRFSIINTIVKKIKVYDYLTKQKLKNTVYESFKYNYSELLTK